MLYDLLPGFNGAHISEVSLHELSSTLSSAHDVIHVWTRDCIYTELWLGREVHPPAWHWGER